MAAKKAPGPPAGKVAVRTPNKPGYVGNVDAAKHAAMKAVLLKVMPRKPPGLTQNEMMRALGDACDRKQFPGTTHMWWGKCVQLDLEAQGLLTRDGGKPLRWWRVK